MISDLRPRLWRPRVRSLAHAIIFGLTTLGFSGQFTPCSFAGLFTLVDDNSFASFDTNSHLNNYSWQVDGVNQLVQQAFWYRIGANAEQSLSTLPHPVEGATDTDFDGDLDTLFIRYNGAGYQIEVRYVLQGGAPGSGGSDITEQIRIDNLGDAPLDFHFYQYSDFDMNGTSINDSAVFTNLNAVRQWEGTMALTETVVTPVPGHREIASYPVTLSKLTDGVPTILSDTPIGLVMGPADLTWAYQWDTTIPAGGTFQISKDKNLVSVAIPEPSSLILLATSLGLILAGRCKLRPR